MPPKSLLAARLLSPRQMFGMPRPVSQVASPRPPGAPPFGPAPRLPDLGASAPYDPPVSVFVPEQTVLPNLGLDDRQEAIRTQIPLLGLGVTLDGTVTSPIVPIGTTKRAWDGIDVYLAPPPDFQTTVGGFRVRIFAISQGARALVASGVYSALDSLTNAATPVLVAAYRGAAERFEVTCQAVGLDPAYANQTVPNTRSFTCVMLAKEDVDTSAPEFVGVSRSSTLDRIASSVLAPLLGSNITDPSLDLEIVGVRACNQSAGVLWFHIVQAFSVADAGGKTPIFKWPLGIAGSVAVPRELFAGFRSLGTGLVAGGSSTPNTFTSVAANNVSWAVLVR